MLWKVKRNLQDLIDEKSTRDRILNEFHRMGYEELPCLYSIGDYVYELEDSAYFYRDRNSVIQNLKKDAKELLQEILAEEIKNPEFKISTFKRLPRLKCNFEITGTNDSKKWWELWK